MNKTLLTLTALAGTSFSALAAPIVVPAGSTLLASWSFEAVTFTGTSATANAGIADIGVQTAGSLATGSHASAATTYSTPAGNGSAKAFSSNTWGLGDYYQFQVDTTGRDNLYLTWGQVGSSTGPRDFSLAYSTDGTTFTNSSAYTVASAPSWNAVTLQSTTIYTVDLTSITALNNDSSVFFRLATTSTTSIGGGTVATGGTGRVDDFTVSDGPVQIVPEPTTALTLVSGLGVLGLLRRRNLRA